MAVADRNERESLMTPAEISKAHAISSSLKTTYFIIYALIITPFIHKFVK
jgi:hypothetical protein|tara:strand:+ start:361 stop:510 length:150 start_codon:yes stop_codon:yes gene_type:complete